MTIAFCNRCDHLLYTNGSTGAECPFCAAPLSETEAVIARRAQSVLDHTVLAARRTVDATTGHRRQRLLRG
jgi:hypothetical protein